MKKIKVLLSALAMVAAMAFVSCGGGAGDDPTGGKSGSDAVIQTVTYSNVYGKLIWAAEDDWAEFTIDFAEVPTKVQFCCEGDVTSSENQKYGEMYYSGSITTTSKTVVIADALAVMKGKNGDTKVTKVILAAENDATATAKIKSVKVKKTDGSVEEIGTSNATKDNCSVQ